MLGGELGSIPIASPTLPRRELEAGRPGQTSCTGRGCVKTLFDTTLGCPRTIAEALIVDSGAFYEVDILLN